MAFRKLLIAFIALCAAPAAWATLPIQHWQTSSGARVYFVENRDLPILDLSVDFPAGSGADTPEKSGVASLTRNLLPTGADGLTEDDIAKAMADVGAVLGGRFDQDRAGLGLRTLSSARERKQALEVFSRVLQKPGFPEKVLEREKARVIAALKESETKPDSIVDRAFNKLLYGDHPYGLRGSGEIDTVSRIQREDLVAFYRGRYLAGSAVIAIMGDLSRAEAEALAEDLTRGLPSGRVTATVPAVKAPARETVQRIPHPATQAHINMGYPGVTRDDPDYFPLYVGNYILGGGGFVSRLNQEVREKRGFAYSVYSYFAPLKQQGPFEIGLQTKKEQADEALGLVRRTVDEFIAKGPTEKELRAAKQNIIGGFPLRIDSNKKIHEYLALIGFYQLPLTYLDDFLRKVGQVTVADIRSAFFRRIRPDAMVTVIVGGADAK
ncbi:MAG: insulinase family protein [Betaproteobacteria bacterium]|nr:insulinase family protein [Betaproteobacteria bacterium]